MGDGHLNKCKNCTRKDSAENEAKRSADPAWLVKERQRHRVKAQKYRNDGRAFYDAEKERLAKKAWSFANPKKRAAHSLVARAVRAGKLIKQPCEVCGVLNVQAHHDDYTKIGRAHV